MRPDTMKISVNSGNARLDWVADAIEGFIEATLGEGSYGHVADLREVKSAISEAISNAYYHAYPVTAPGEIEIQCTLDFDNNNRLTVIVKDTGNGIADIEKARQPFYTRFKENLEHSGMGFTILETFMDTCEVVSEIGRGTTVTMTKQLS